MDLEKMRIMLEMYSDLIKADIKAKKVPELPSSADMGNMPHRSKKMDGRQKHMNGKNVEQYNHEGEKEIHKRVPKKVANLNKGEEGPDMASPDKPKGLENKRKPVTHDECGRPFAKDDIDEKIKAKMKQEMGHRNFGEADATRHVIDRDRGEKMPQKPKEQKPLLQTEVIKYDSNGQWSFEKSNYGPKGYGLYSEKDNVRRKAKNTGESFADAGKNVNAKKYTTSGSSMSQAHEAAQQKKYTKESKASLRTLADMSPEEKAKLEAQYNTKLNKSEIEISEWDDGVIEIDFHDDTSAEVDFLVKKLEEAGYEELEKKKDWAPKAKHKSDKGGLTAAGRKSYNKATGGNLKAPQPGGGPRKRSFCARNKGQIDMHNIDCRKNPDKRACKARRRWKC